MQRIDLVRPRVERIAPVLVVDPDMRLAGRDLDDRLARDKKVSAAAAVAAAPAGGGAAAAAPVEEKTEFDVVLKDGRVALKPVPK